MNFIVAISHDMIVNPIVIDIMVMLLKNISFNKKGIQIIIDNPRMLSAMESNLAPNFVSWLSFLARNPSKKSVDSAMINKIPIVVFCSLKKKNHIIIKIMILDRVRKLGIVLIFSDFIFFH